MRRHNITLKHLAVDMYPLAVASRPEKEGAMLNCTPKRLNTFGALHQTLSTTDALILLPPHAEYYFYI